MNKPQKLLEGHIVPLVHVVGEGELLARGGRGGHNSSGLFARNTAAVTQSTVGQRNSLRQFFMHENVTIRPILLRNFDSQQIIKFLSGLKE